MNTDRLKAKALTVEDNPKWVEGYVYQGSDGENTRIFAPEGSDAVNPDTLCQCTGLKDKEGDLIFEGDELEYDLRHGVDKVGFVTWDSLHTGFVCRVPVEGGTHRYSLSMGGSNVLSITLTGKNIHDINQ